MNKLLIMLALVWNSESHGVGLVGGTCHFTGRLEMKHQAHWRPVDGWTWNQKSPGVVCRQLDRGSAVSIKAVSTHKTVWMIPPPCVGSESSLRVCGTNKFFTSTSRLELICSESNGGRLVGGTSHRGRLEMKYQRAWRPVDDYYSNHKSSSVEFGQLEYVSAVEEWNSGSTQQHVCLITSDFVESETSLIEYGTKQSSTSTGRLDMIYSESVRLVNGHSLGSGRVEEKSNQSLVSVCEVDLKQHGDFDQLSTAVVCRELSVLQGELYGEVEALMWTKESSLVQEFSLLDCGTSGSTRNSCSPDNTVEPVTVTSHCTGRLEVKDQGEWRPVDCYLRDLSSSAVYRQLGCGPDVLSEQILGSTHQPVWKIPSPSSVMSESSQRGTFTDTQTTIRSDSFFTASHLKAFLITTGVLLVLCLILLGIILYHWWKATREYNAVMQKIRWKMTVTKNNRMKPRQTSEFQRRSEYGHRI